MTHHSLNLHIIQTQHLQHRTRISRQNTGTHKLRHSISCSRPSRRRSITPTQTNITKKRGLINTRIQRPGSQETNRQPTLTKRRLPAFSTLHKPRLLRSQSLPRRRVRRDKPEIALRNSRLTRSQLRQQTHLIRIRCRRIHRKRPHIRSVTIIILIHSPHRSHRQHPARLRKLIRAHTSHPTLRIRIKITIHRLPQQCAHSLIRVSPNRPRNLRTAINPRSTTTIHNRHQRNRTQTIHDTARLNPLTRPTPLHLNNHIRQQQLSLNNLRITRLLYHKTSIQTRPISRKPASTILRRLRTNQHRPIPLGNDRHKRQPKNQCIKVNVTRRRSKPIRSIHTIQTVAVTISPAKPIQTLLQSIHRNPRPRHHRLHTLQLRRNSHTKVTHPIRALIVALNTAMPRRQPLNTIVHALNQSQLIRVHTTDTRFLPDRSRRLAFAIFAPR